MNPINAVILAGGLLPSDDPAVRDCPPTGAAAWWTSTENLWWQWVVDALSQSNAIGTLYIMGLNEQAGLKSEKPCIYLPDDGGVFENIHAGVIRSAQDYPDREKVILASADIPALTCEMVDWLVGQVEENPEKQLYYNIIPRPVMETQFPTSARSYIHFKDMAVCGGDLNAVDVTLFSKERSIWKSLAKARKHPLQQASLLGLDTLLLVLLRAITLEGAVKKVLQQTGYHRNGAGLSIRRNGDGC